MNCARTASTPDACSDLQLISVLVLALNAPAILFLGAELVLQPANAQPDFPAAFAAGFLVVLLTPLAFWAIGRKISRRQAQAREALRAEAAAPVSEGAVRYLQAGTGKAGDFVILTHAAEDLRLSPVQLSAAVAEARAEDPRLEHRMVAGRLILRRPRV